MNTIFDLLEKNKRKEFEFSRTDSYNFFLTNRHLLGKLKRFAYLKDNEKDEFKIIRCIILIKGLSNKRIIESKVNDLINFIQKNNKEDFVPLVKSELENQPYMLDGEQRIYLPFFSRAINLIYYNQPEQLNEYPYYKLMKSYRNLLIDAFDYYGAKLFNSSFTNLKFICEYNNHTAFLNEETATIYLVNDQGRLTERICLFDRYMMYFDMDNIMEKAKELVEVYFDDNRENFIKKLLNLRFISEKMYFKLNVNR